MTKQSLAKPFIKWAGGKQKVLSQLEQYLPNELKEGKCHTYIEPFVGGGAMLFYVLQRYSIDRAIISDTNSDLITTFLAVKQNVDELISRLKELQEHYYSLEEAEKSIFYYQMRAKFNQKKDASIELAAQFIFLNKTCFNGLYRVNKNGEFNVPIGRYTKPVICDEENLRLCSVVLRNVEIYNQSYEKNSEWFASDVFCFFDPPYRPLNASKSFTKYQAYGFSEDDQIALAAFYSEMNRQGSKLMLCNSDPTSMHPEDDFFDKNYQGCNIHRIQANRSINSNPSRRGKVSELVITNY
ncbi:DNA adenine methylase Dam [Ureibacillus xyleni]|uniref:site-specific DNA-methyltransferase (adenine-specific) n=1 Tax=Ureibacillus xyleni TaxID=614648 RepID=A0A285R896_9BACL|nr:DNA adenine methylase [Ureibacillus xyleni]SOB90333.1 DNA adenine methylase Dam [Ureibacillus xyleni]